MPCSLPKPVPPRINFFIAGYASLIYIQLCPVKIVPPGYLLWKHQTLDIT